MTPPTDSPKPFWYAGRERAPRPSDGSTQLWEDNKRIRLVNWNAQTSQWINDGGTIVIGPPDNWRLLGGSDTELEPLDWLRSSDNDPDDGEDATEADVFVGVWNSQHVSCEDVYEQLAWEDGCWVAGSTGRLLSDAPDYWCRITPPAEDASICTECGVDLARDEVGTPYCPQCGLEYSADEVAGFEPRLREMIAEDEIAKERDDAALIALTSKPNGWPDSCVSDVDREDPPESYETDWAQACRWLDPTELCVLLCGLVDDDDWILDVGETENKDELALMPRNGDEDQWFVRKADNEVVQVKGSEFILRGSEGEEIHVTPYFPRERMWPTNAPIVETAEP
jgi:hypothetical protein